MTDFYCSCLLTKWMLIVFLSAMPVCPLPRALFFLRWADTSSSLRSFLPFIRTASAYFWLTILSFAPAKPSFAPTKPSFAATKPSFAATKRKKTLSGARQLFVFRRKRSDVRHTISLSRRSRFLTPLSSLRHRERQKGGGGVKGLHLSPYWQADYNNE